MRILLGLVLCFLLGANAADAHVRSLTVNNPRAFGYFEGDVIRREVVLDVAQGDRLDPASIPRAGPLDYWLELKSADLQTHAWPQGTRYRLELQYQTFYSALDPHKLTIPGFTLRLASGAGGEDVQVPAWSFVISPLRELFVGAQADDPGSVTLQNDAPPLLLQTDLERRTILVSALFASVALLWLAHHLAWWPFRENPRRPFTEAARFIRAHGSSLAGAGGYRAALVKLHRAFDISAGRRVLPDDIGVFLREHPEFKPLSGDIERVFACSRQAFFGSDVSKARAAMPLNALADLATRLGNAERAAA